ncbi:MAG TPA: hypothetical protein VGO59_12165 [Verrucomicrobiae bacterium]|jgi:hypothetical protein
MKMTEKKTTPAALLQPAFHKVAENLYRLESSAGYYALVKKGGKLFRRSFKAGAGPVLLLIQFKSAKEIKNCEQD